MPPEPHQIQRATKAAVGAMLGNSPAHPGPVELIALGWATNYWDGPGYAESVASEPYDLARPFALLAAIQKGQCRDRWNRFVQLTVADVLADGAHPLAAPLRTELEVHLRRVLREARDDPPHLRWLESSYRYAFTFCRRTQPVALPAWWDEILGPIAGVPSTPPPDDPPEDAMPLPEQSHLDQFVESECQGNSVLAAVLCSLGTETVALTRDQERMTGLVYAYLRYWNAPCLEDTPTPESPELANHLNGIGFKTAHGGQVSVANLDTILCRLRKRVRDLLRDAVREGRLPVDEEWICLAFPRPLLYDYGRLFAPLPPNQATTDGQARIGGTL